MHHVMHCVMHCVLHHVMHYVYCSPPRAARAGPSLCRPSPPRPPCQPRAARADARRAAAPRGHSKTCQCTPVYAIVCTVVSHSYREAKYVVISAQCVCLVLSTCRARRRVYQIYARPQLNADVDGHARSRHTVCTYACICMHMWHLLECAAVPFVDDLRVEMVAHLHSALHGALHGALYSSLRSAVYIELPPRREGHAPSRVAGLAHYGCRRGLLEYGCMLQAWPTTVAGVVY